MHITHPESGVMITTGVVGSSMLIANGLALASQLSGDGRVTVAYFGDGASNIGAFHEALEYGVDLAASGGVCLPEQWLRRAYSNRQEYCRRKYIAASGVLSDAR